MNRSIRTLALFDQRTDDGKNCGNKTSLMGFILTCVKWIMSKWLPPFTRGYTGLPITQIQKWPQSRGLKANFDLPGGLREKPAEGCRVVEWNGHKAAPHGFWTSAAPLLRARWVSTLRKNGFDFQFDSSVKISHSHGDRTKAADVIEELDCWHDQ